MRRIISCNSLKNLHASVDNVITELTYWAEMANQQATRAKYNTYTNMLGFYGN